MINNKQMAQDIFINIADLPQASEITAGDYFIVENAAGTQIINFADIIIPVENTLITPQVVANTTTIETLSVSNQRSFETITTTVDILSTDLKKIEELTFDNVKDTINLQTSAVLAFNSIDRIYNILNEEKVKLEDSTTRLNEIEETINSSSRVNKLFVESYPVTYDANQPATVTIMFKIYAGMGDLNLDDITFAPINNYAKQYTKYIEAYDIQKKDGLYHVKTRAFFKKKNTNFQFSKTTLQTTLSGKLDDSLSSYSVETFTDNILSHVLSSVSINENAALTNPEEDASFVMLLLGEIIS
jgi:hypothetical protein